MTRRFWPMLLIVLGVLALLASMVLPVTHSVGVLFFVLACAFIASGLLVMIANRRFKTL
jgi:uncharacterized membrane protein HdeD (DUF308 family)